MTGEPDRSAVFISIAASHRPGDTLEDLHDQLLTARADVMRSNEATWLRFRSATASEPTKPAPAS